MSADDAVPCPACDAASNDFGVGRRCPECDTVFTVDDTGQVTYNAGRASNPMRPDTEDMTVVDLRHKPGPPAGTGGRIAKVLERDEKGRWLPADDETAQKLNETGDDE